MHLAQGTLLKNGEYKINQMLGQGGFGITYLAEQVNLGRTVAIKEFYMKELNMRGPDFRTVTTPSIDSARLVDEFRVKFVKEARKIASMKHPHIIQVIDVFEDNGTVYYVMPYYSGGSLSEQVKKYGPYNESDALLMIRPIAAALYYMHNEKKMCHYDVKPDNILLDENGSPILIDFGISKNYDFRGNETSSTPISLSEGYAPIEQYQGEVKEFSPESDVYALGATLYFMLTGQRPPKVADRISGAQLYLPATCSPAMRQLIETSMAITRRNRPATTEVFLQELPLCFMGDSRPHNEHTILRQDAPYSPPQQSLPQPASMSAPIPQQELTPTADVMTEEKSSKPWMKFIPIIAAALVVATVIGLLLAKCNKSDDLSNAPAPDGLSGNALGYYVKAMGGDAEAQFNLGVCYHNGQEANQDYSHAVYWFRKAAEQGNADAQCELGYCYHEGQGVPQVYKEAVNWFRKAADKGNAKAQFSLGYCYHEGHGVPQVYGQAVDWYRKAAEQGNARAQCELGYCYDEGQGVEQDYGQAVEWYRKAAEQGDHYAQCNLGYCYEMGNGVAKDESTAIELYRSAARQGNEVAQQNLENKGKSW